MYRATAARLLLDREHREFQAFLLCLGVPVADLFLLSMYGPLLLQQFGHMTPAGAAQLVALPYSANIFARLVSIAVAEHVSSLNFVLLGAAFLLAGTAASLGLALPAWLAEEAWAPSFPAAFSVAATLMHTAFGLILPNCEAGGLLGVAADDGPVAASLLKLSPLAATALAQAVLSLAGCERSPQRFVCAMLGWNLPPLALLGWWRCSLRRARGAVAEAEEGGEMMTVESSVGSPRLAAHVRVCGRGGCDA